MVSEDGSRISGEWDEVKLAPFACCVFHALRADQMISIDFTGSAMTLGAAAMLVDAAFKRIDQPLALDGAANVAAARTFLAGRPRPMDPCSVLTRAEVEAIVGTLATAPKADAQTCSYELPQLPGHPPRVYDLQFAWHDGNYELRQDLHAAKMAGVALGSTAMQVTTQQQVPNAPDAGPWERSAGAGPNFEAVKKDVMVKVNTFGVDTDNAKALVSAAMAKF
jgi:hypothetical protein